MERDEIVEVFDIDLAATDRPEIERAEPVLVSAPYPNEPDEPRWLDPGRAQAEPERSLSPQRRERSVLGALGSLCLHLLPLLALIHWTIAPPEIDRPIPVQLVLEAPPAPAPAPAPKLEKPPPPGRLASENMGETAKEATAPPGAAEPDHAQLAAIVPPPPPKPVPPPPKAADLSPDWHRLDAVPKDALREARVPGPAATRDEYLAYLVTLTRRHIDLLPLSLIGDRRGETVIELLVLADGTIARINVAHASGYPEIDERIEQMVAAVRRFPPLPQWYQGPSIALDFRLRFPEALEH